MKPEIGDVIEIDAAVFHKAGVDGACHIEQGIEYVVMGRDGHCTELLCALTVDQEEELRDSIASYLKSLTLDPSDPESNPIVYTYHGIKEE